MSRGELLNVRYPAQRDRGSVSVTVIMVPFILLVIMLVVQVGLAGYARKVAAGAAQQGALQAAVYEGSPGSGAAYAMDLFSASAGGVVTDSSASSSSTGNAVSVTINATVVRVFPLLPTFSISATGSANRERFVPEGAP